LIFHLIPVFFGHFKELDGKSLFTEALRLEVFHA